MANSRSKKKNSWNNDVKGYLSSLCASDRERYNNKLRVDGLQLPDPYSLEDCEWKIDVSLWPDIGFGDIWTYLVHTPGIFTAESMKAYKSLDGYNFFASGKVMPLLLYTTEESTVSILKSTVQPSQSNLNEKKKWHHPWVVVSKSNGSVISAHCTCKAGLGEACSHVAAVLFKVEAAMKLGLNEVSKTSLANTWNRYYKEKVEAQPIQDIDFSRNRHGLESNRRMRKAVRPNLPKLDVKEALRTLKKAIPDACALDSDSEDEEPILRETTIHDELPPMLIRRHAAKRDLSQEQLEEESKLYVEDFKVTDEQCRYLEEATRGQSSCALWRRHRVGRITSSVAHQVKTLKKETSPQACIATIMRDNHEDISRLSCIKYGVRNETKAKKMYAEEAARMHEDFSMRDSGLVVDSVFPIFAASPDGVRTCSCHGEGLIEVKCCFKYRTEEVQSIPNMDSKFYLVKDTLELRKGHQYYTQVQFQMYVCQKTFCDFIVFTDKGIFFQTIYYDPDYVHQVVNKCFAFAIEHIVPEIVKRKMEEQ